MKSFSKAFGRIVLILTVVIALVASVFVVPKLFGINPYVVLSGSMEPQIHTGAIAFVNTKDTAVKVGDVVTYPILEKLLRICRRYFNIAKTSLVY